MSREQRVLVLAVASLIACRWIAASVLPIYDDAFITFRYARNLASGHGFTYFPGEWVQGVTSPAFGVFLSIFYLLHAPMPSTVLALNVAFDAALLCLVWLTARRIGRTALALIFAILFALSPISARITVGGMEMSLFVLASFCAVLLYHAGHGPAAISVATASCFLRPEGIVLAGLLWLQELWRDRRSALRLGLLAAAIAAPPLLILAGTYGSILPHSVVAKSGTLHRPLLNVVRTLLAPEPLALALVPLAVLGAAVWFRQDRVLKTLAIWAGLYTAAYLLARPSVWSWYGAPIHVVSQLFAAAALIYVAERLFGGRLRSTFTLASRPGYALAVLLLPLVAWSAMLAWKGPSGTTRNILDPLETFCGTSISRDSSIMAGDIGAIGYYSGARILDTVGLVWPPALQLRSDQEIVRAYHPDYLFMNATREKIRMLAEDPAFRDYEPLRRFSPTSESEMRLKPELYPDVFWIQDYLLLARRANTPAPPS